MLTKSEEIARGTPRKSKGNARELLGGPLGNIRKIKGNC
jgi:hypothetical protein